MTRSAIGRGFAHRGQGLKYPAAALVARIPSRPFASSTKESKIIYIVAAAPRATEPDAT